MKNSKPNQANQILKYLRTGKSLTPLEALVKFSCFRLAARVLELKKRGIKIKTTTKINKLTKKKFASYSI